MQRHGRRFRLVRAASLALLLFTPAVAQAQVPWESPQMLAPGTPPGIGFYFVDFGLAPADGIGAMIMYRNQTAPGGTGLRFAGTRGNNEDEPRFSGGIDFTVPMFMHSPAFPLDVIWTSGIGASHGDYVQLALPVGFAAGRAIQGNTIWFNPYLSTRAVFEAYIGEDRPENAFGLALAADVGTDVSFGRGRSLVFRFAASLGDRHALVAGIHTAFGR